MIKISGKNQTLTKGLVVIFHSLFKEFLQTIYLSQL